MGEQHLDLLALSPRDEPIVGRGDGPGHVARTFVDRAHDLAGRHVGRAALAQLAPDAVLLAGAIADEAILIGE